MMNDIKGFLDEWVEKINVPAFIETDPEQFPLRYADRKDREVVTFVVSTITWGKRSMILNSAEKMLRTMGESPYDYIRSGGYKKLGTANIHRTFFEQDLAYFCRGLDYYYSREESLEKLFVSSSNPWEGITLFRETMAKGNDGEFSKHISNPQTDSACKRLHLALRWLVRDDGKADYGIWKEIHPSALYIPLDVHVGRTSRALGLISRKQNDRKSVEMLTEKLRSFCPEDPVKYDFALFGIGESGAASILGNVADNLSRLAYTIL